MRRESTENPKIQAVISADKGVEYGKVVEIIDLVKQNGVGAFALDIERGGARRSAPRQHPDAAMDTSPRLTSSGAASAPPPPRRRPAPLSVRKRPCAGSARARSRGTWARPLTPAQRAHDPLPHPRALSRRALVAGRRCCWARSPCTGWSSGGAGPRRRAKGAARERQPGGQDRGARAAAAAPAASSARAAQARGDREAGAPAAEDGGRAAAAQGAAARADEGAAAAGGGAQHGVHLRGWRRAVVRGRQHARRARPPRRRRDPKAVPEVGQGPIVADRRRGRTRWRRGCRWGARSTRRRRRKAGAGEAGLSGDAQEPGDRGGRRLMVSIDATGKVVSVKILEAVPLSGVQRGGGKAALAAGVRAGDQGRQCRCPSTLSFTYEVPPGGSMRLAEGVRELALLPGPLSAPRS